jgi:antirestriction protein ArdC
MHERFPHHASHDRAPQPGKDHPAEAGQDRIAGILRQLEEGIDGILSDEGFARYLRVMARFPGYSATNVALILFQQPEATKVAGYRMWQSLGRQVKKGETGIKIFVPFRRRLPRTPETEEGSDEEEQKQQRAPLGAVTGFGLGTVFDVAQTEGDPLPEPPSLQEIDGTSDLGWAIDQRLSRWLLDEGLTLTKVETGRARGYYRPDSRTIALSNAGSGDQQTKTLVHEAAHYVADHRGQVERRDAETVAESSAFVVLTHFGLDTSGYSFPYVATWAADRQVLKRNLGEIQGVSRTLIEAITAERSDPDDITESDQSEEHLIARSLSPND